MLLRASSRFLHLPFIGYTKWSCTYSRPTRRTWKYVTSLLAIKSLSSKKLNLLLRLHVTSPCLSWHLPYKNMFILCSLRYVRTCSTAHTQFSLWFIYFYGLICTASIEWYRPIFSPVQFFGDVTVLARLSIFRDAWVSIVQRWNSNCDKGHVVRAYRWHTSSHEWWSVWKIEG